MWRDGRIRSLEQRKLATFYRNSLVSTDMTTFVAMAVMMNLSAETRFPKIDAFAIQLARAKSISYRVKGDESGAVLVRAETPDRLRIDYWDGRSIIWNGGTAYIRQVPEGWYEDVYAAMKTAFTLPHQGFESFFRTQPILPYRLFSSEPTSAYEKLTESAIFWGALYYDLRTGMPAGTIFREYNEVSSRVSYSQIKLNPKFPPDLFRPRM